MKFVLESIFTVFIGSILLIFLVLFYGLKKFILKTGGGKYAKNWQNTACWIKMNQKEILGFLYSRLESRTNRDNFCYIYKFGIVLR